VLLPDAEASVIFLWIRYGTGRKSVCDAAYLESRDSFMDLGMILTTKETAQ